MTKALELLGVVFDRLTVVARAESNRYGTNWLCRCSCGVEKVVATVHLRTGMTRSCGCLGRESRVARNTKHGLAQRGRKTPEYHLWCAARKRALESAIPCSLAVTDIQIPLVCPVLGIPLRPGCRKNHDASPSLDRIDSSKGYTPDNVWVISYRANRIKNDATLDELRRVVRALEAKYGEKP